MAEVATKAHIDNLVRVIRQGFGNIDRRFEVFNNFASIDRRFEAVNNRLDRMIDILIAVQSQMAAITRWADRFDRTYAAILQTQSAQQRAIDDLAARVRRLEEKKAS